MHLQTHILSGWCAGNCFRLTARERFLAMTAAVLPDLDGVTYVLGREAYWATHHVYGHNLLFAVAASGALTLFCSHRLKCFLLYLGLFHLHYALDLLGSGEGWVIPYFLPFAPTGYSWSSGWEFNAWQNKVAALALLVWTLAIAVYCRRTPLEWPMPRLDGQLVELAQKLRPPKK